MWKFILQRERLTRCQLLACAVLGLLSAIVVAWSVHLISYGSFKRLGEGSWNEGPLQGMWGYQREAFGQWSLFYVASKRPIHEFREGLSPPSWARGISAADVLPDPRVVVTCRAVGMPFPCFAYHERMVIVPGVLPQPPTVEGAFPLSWRPAALKVLPYRPIWINLIANSVIFSVLIAALWYAFQVARLNGRIRKQHCRCGYPYQKGLCPECGENMERFFTA